MRPSLNGEPKLLLSAFARRNVHNGAEHQEAFAGVNWRQTDLYREFTAVLALAVEFTPLTAVAITWMVGWVVRVTPLTVVVRLLAEPAVVPVRIAV